MCTTTLHFENLLHCSISTLLLKCMVQNCNSSKTHCTILVSFCKNFLFHHLEFEIVSSFVPLVVFVVLVNCAALWIRFSVCQFVFNASEAWTPISTLMQLQSSVKQPAKILEKMAVSKNRLRIYKYLLY